MPIPAAMNPPTLLVAMYDAAFPICPCCIHVTTSTLNVEKVVKLFYDNDQKVITDESQ
jgi:hypothetical protein